MKQTHHQKQTNILLYVWKKLLTLKALKLKMG